MKIISKIKTNNALLLMQGQRITCVGHSIGGTINVDVSQLRRFRYHAPSPGSKFKRRGGYGKIGRICLFSLGSFWSMTQSNGAVVLRDSSIGKRIEKDLDDLLKRKITKVTFNGQRPMFTFHISGGLSLRVFSEDGQNYAGWDVSVRRASKKLYFRYQEDPFQDHDIA
jgi:hypothetical protein